MPPPSPPQPVDTHGTKSAHGTGSGNKLQPPIAQVYLWLRFYDPDNQVRDFPEGLKVKVRHGTPPHHKEKQYQTTKSGTKAGLLSFPAKFQIPEGWLWEKTWKVWHSFTLIWDDTTAPAAQYMLCEKAGAATKTQVLASDADLANASPPIAESGRRYFRLPAKWSLKSAEWDAPTFPGGLGSYDAAWGLINQNTLHIGLHDIGTEENPVQLVLRPHWRWVRFEFFDRRWGHGAQHGDKRVAPPPLAMQGFRKADPADADKPDALSNWWAPAAGSPPSNIVQCMPWINWYTDADGKARSALTKLKGSNTLLKYETPAHTYVYSKSATERLLVQIPDGDARLDPGVERLQYYDLPPVWKSKVYYTRIGGGDKFFQDVTEGEVDDSAAPAKALGFSLDDLVLYRDNAGTLEPLNAWDTGKDRVAVLNHRFDNTVGAGAKTHHGVYKKKDPAGAVNQFNLPQSDVVVTRTPGNKDVYLYDYPDWTRLVLAQGNVFDVFDRRAPNVVDNARVVGARAAVRWVDASQPFSGITTEEWGWVVAPPPPPGTAGWIAAAGPHNPVPGRKLSAAVRAAGRPALIEQPAGKPLYAYQPFHFQNCTEFPKHYDVNRTTWFGRCDMLLLRCCDVTAAGDELATQMHYIRAMWDGSANDGTGKEFNDSVSINTSARWNGADAINNCRALLLPAQSPPVKLSIQVVWFDQAVEESRAHFKLTVGAGRSNRGSGDGTGEYNNPGDKESQADGWHTSAHESGHMNGLPDDYNERWNCASYDQMSYQANGPPGDPYEADGRQDATQTFDGGIYTGSLMNVNARIRGRYFWPSAEWASRVMGVPLKVKFQDALDTASYEYVLPPHTKRDEDRTYVSWPYLGARNATRNANSPTSPPTANWDKFEYYLYPLGKDHYSQHVLAGLCRDAKGWRPGGSPPAGSPPASPPAALRFDGLLVIDLRLECTMSDDATVATEDDYRENITAQMAAAVRMGMCYRWRFSGSFGSPPLRFDNCLIHFAPLLMVANDPNGHYGAKVWDVAALRTEYGSHFNVEVDFPGPAGTVWDAGARQLTLNCGAYADVAAGLQDEFPKFFGFNKTMAAINAADVALMVNLLGGSGVAVTEVP
jgi:hypothetical protein